MFIAWLTVSFDPDGGPVSVTSDSVGETPRRTVSANFQRRKTARRCVSQTETSRGYHWGRFLPYSEWVRITICLKYFCVSETFRRRLISQNKTLCAPGRSACFHSPTGRAWERC